MTENGAMNCPIKLSRILGIASRVNATFLLLLSFTLFSASMT